jgi:hypothetical protein
MSAGSMVLLDSYTVSGTPATVIIGGGTGGSSGSNVVIDSTYNFYIITLTNVKCATDDRDLYFRVTKSGDGTESAVSQYDYAADNHRSNSDAGSSYASGQTAWLHNADASNSPSEESMNGMIYPLNFQDSTNYSYAIFDLVATTDPGGTANSRSFTGGGTHTVGEANDGLKFYWASSANFSAGTFKLYGLNK